MRERRICILTQPLSNGYGGLLQAYALQVILKRLGHKVWTEDRRRNASLWARCVKSVKSLIIRCIGPLMTKLTNVFYSTSQDIQRINQHTDYFKDKYIVTTKPIYSNKKDKLHKYGFDTYIVGSDQVWRPRYSYGPNAIYNYFLDFTKGMDVKRIAYAASFGVSEWEFSDEQTRICASLLRQFDAVSVRENDGIDLCKRYFGIDAKQVLDPTLLLQKEDYINLVERENEPRFSDNLFCYFLDSSEEKKEISEEVAKDLNLRPFSIMPTALFYQVGPKHFDECIYAPVTAWLRAYMDADFIVTDSFHGTVFAIIFNKPFITIANKSRGLSRFTSVLKLFGLEDRLIYSKAEITHELLAYPIDFERVNKIKADKQNEALEFLNLSLNSTIESCRQSRNL